MVSGVVGTAKRAAVIRSAKRRWYLVVAAAPLLVYVAHLVLYWPHVNDDAFITFRYSRFLASGWGPYFNHGEHVEGYTSFLFMLILTPFATLGEAVVPVAARWIGVLSGAGVLATGFGLATKVGPASNKFPRALLATAIVAMFPGVAVNCTSGLETGLYALLVVLAVYREGRLSAMLWGAVILTRPEGIAAFGLWWLGRLMTDRRNWRSLSIDGILVAGVVLGHLVFRWIAYDGELLPNTWYAKGDGYLGISAWTYVRRGGFGPFFGVAGVAIGVVGCLRAWRDPAYRRQSTPVLAVALGGTLLPFATGADWMPGWRFSVPYLMPLAVVVVNGWFDLLRPILDPPRRPWLEGGVATAAALILLGLHHDERMILREGIHLRAEGYRRGHEALAQWIKDGAVQPGGSVALMDIGIVGYRCADRRILDVSGLTDAVIAHSPGPFLMKDYDPAYVLDQDPDIIVVALTAPGDPTAPLPYDQRLGTWTRTEYRLVQHPDFRDRYQRRRAPDSSEDWLAQLAARIGAERVFEHLHPGQYYLLAAFPRQRPALGSG